MSFRLPTVVTNLTQQVTQLGNAVTGKSGDAKYFETTKRGELHELKHELHSPHKEKKKEAVKKVIAAMTLGKDVSQLFPDVVNCMQTTNIELKKLVYLYVINYARAQPELAILAVNTFRKDSLDSNALIRALAVRTMGCIRLEQITEYLVDPLRRACKDSDPYVRKTASICICKLHDCSPSTVYHQGFIELLQDMLTDSNPMVIANAVASLSEISEASNKNFLKLTDSTIHGLLTALNEASEWGQVFILDALSAYIPASTKDAESTLERIIPRLSHANPAVVMSSIRVVMKMLDHVASPELIASTQKKLSSPLITLLSREPEIQYVALRNIRLIVQRRPEVMSKEVKIFFCKYNDPVYVKLEKLEMIVRLASDSNVDQVLAELREYATEVDVDFVRRTVRAIGRCAIKLENAVEKCVAVLLKLISTRVNYVVQEAIVVIKDIFRKYPNRYENVIGTLCENLDSLDDPEAKAAMVWIIGEYAERIDNAAELIEGFLEFFHDEPVIVQQQLLTASVKLFLKLPRSSHSLVTRVLKMATEDTNNPDLRDRGYIYWRLLSTDPEATKKVVLAEKPPISDSLYSIDPVVLDRLIDNISTLASVFHKVPEAFVTRLRFGGRDENDSSSEAGEDGDEDEDERIDTERIKGAMGRLSYSSDEGSDARDDQKGEKEDEADSASDESAASPRDLLGGSSDEEDHVTRPGGASTSGPSDAPRALRQTHPYVIRPLLTPERLSTTGQPGLQIDGALTRNHARMVLLLKITNRSQAVLSQWAIKFNNNSFGLSPAQQLSVVDLSPMQSADVVLPLEPNVLLSQTPPSNPPFVEVAIRCSLGVFCFNVPYDLSVVFQPKQIDDKTYMTHWERMGQAKQISSQALCAESLTQELIVERLSHYGFLHHPGITKLSSELAAFAFHAVTSNNLLLLVQIVTQLTTPVGGVVTFNIRSDSPKIVPPLQSVLAKALTATPHQPGMHMPQPMFPTAGVGASLTLGQGVGPLI